MSTKTDLPTQETARRHRRVLRFLRAIIGLGILVEIGLLAYTPDAAAVWAKLTTRQPERFTELYFSDPAKLPKQVKVNQTSDFTYRIVNHEAGITAYHAYVTLYENGVAKRIQADNPVVPAGSSRELHVRFTPTTPNAELQLEITLPAQHQTIHFRSQS